MGDIQNDQSMEDVLASIKRIIAEDTRAAAAPARRRPAARAEPLLAADDEDVLELGNPIRPAETLLSEDAAAASRERLAALTAISRHGDLVPEPAEGGPLEQAVRDMLRPMLKDWLDQHLPEIVEQLVAREVARITRRS